MAADNDRLKTSRGSYSGKEASIAFANSESSHEGRSRGGRLDAIIEEGFNIVGYVVVEPGEDRTGLVCGRREGGGELVGYPIKRRNGFAGELGRVGVWGGEITAEEAGGCGSRYLGLRSWF